LIAANGKPGRAHEVGVVWVLLAVGFFEYTCLVYIDCSIHYHYGKLFSSSYCTHEENNSE